MNVKLLHHIKTAYMPFVWHLLGSALVVAMVGLVVVKFWYPHPYEMMTGGLNILLILAIVDLVCGPLLTLVLFSSQKSRREILLDIGVIICIQFLALVYGVSQVYEARPLFLVHEVDRFRVVAMPDYQGRVAGSQLDRFYSGTDWRWLSGPIVVGVREPESSVERQEVTLDVLSGGRDYGQRPELYVPYDSSYSAKVLKRAKPLGDFLRVHPELMAASRDLLIHSRVGVDRAVFVPVQARHEWVAVLDQSARILGFLPGDGFSVR
ncbi:MAG: pilus assembly protein [Aquabacterium sp.]